MSSDDDDEFAPQRFGDDGSDDDDEGDLGAPGGFGEGRKRRRGQTKEDQIYGVFADSDSDEGGGLGGRGGGRGGRAGRGGHGSDQGYYFKPVNFRSAGQVTGEDDAVGDDDRGARSTGGLGLGATARLGATAGLGLGVTAGLGSGGGLGFVGGGFAPASDQAPAPESESDDEDLLPSTFGQRVMHNAAKRREEAEKARIAAKEAERARLAEREAERAASSSRGGLGSGGGGKKVESIGDFEKHTKGIGMKLLEKMGYKKGGGLGKDGKGMTAPMQTKMRPVKMGMGYGDFKEAGQLNKPSARKDDESRGERSSNGKSESRGKGEPSSITDRLDAEEREQKRRRDATERAMWKRRDEMRRARREYKTAEEVLAERERADRDAASAGDISAPPPMTVVDMRGVTARVVTDLSKLETRDAGASSDWDAEELPFPELRHNLRLIVDLTEAEIQTVDAKIRHEKDTRSLLERERARLARDLDDSVSVAGSVSALLRAAEAADVAARDGTASFGDLAEAHARMAEEHREAYVAHGLRDLALCHARPGLIASLGRDWNPLADPKPDVARAVRLWRRALTVPDAPRGASRKAAASGDTAGGEDPYLDLDLDPVFRLVSEPVAQPIRSSLVQRWNPTNPEPALRVLETWERALPGRVVDDAHASAILPKLRRAAEAWDPSRGDAPPHAWIHPWLPRLGDALHALWPSIRHKMSIALTEWHPSDASALDLLKPWRRVFAARDWDAALRRSVIPKLERALDSELRVDRDWDVVEMATDAETAPLRWTMAWEGLLPSSRFTTLLETRFFPKWRAALFARLTDRTLGPPDLDRVARWYLAWKTLFSEDALAHERVREQFNAALDMMHQAAAGEAVTPPTEAAEAAGRAASGARASRRDPGAGGSDAGTGIGVGAAGVEAGAGAGAKGSSALPASRSDTGDMDDDELALDMSLREVVEAFAVSHDVRFVPKPGRLEAGLRVWSFGAVSATIDAAKQIVRAQVDGRWAPVSLDQLLELHRKKTRAQSKTF